MKLYVTGNVNEYYVQTLAMIFFPGEHFTEKEEPDSPVLWLDTTENEEVRLFLLSHKITSFFNQSSKG